MKIVWELFVNMLQVFILSDFLIRYFRFKNSAPAFRYGSAALFCGSAFAAISVLSSAAPFETASAAATAALNKIVRSYNGIINYSENGDIFSCDILVPLLKP